MLTSFAGSPSLKLWLTLSGVQKQVDDPRRRTRLFVVYEMVLWAEFAFLWIRSGDKFLDHIKPKTKYKLSFHHT